MSDDPALQQPPPISTVGGAFSPESSGSPYLAPESLPGVDTKPVPDAPTLALPPTNTQCIPETPHQPRSAAPVRHGKKSICRHYTRGLCTWGAECRFSHVNSGDTMNHNPAFTAHVPSMMPLMQTPNITMVANPYAAQQQSEHQRQRYGLVMAGATGMFSMQVNGEQAVVTVGATLIPFAVLSRSTLQHHLNALIDKQRGGLNYLVGESSVFWSMVKLLHTEGTTGSPFWDQAFRKAVAGQVSCMYFPSSTGCLTPNCPFIHETPLFNIVPPRSMPNAHQCSPLSQCHVSHSSVGDVGQSSSTSTVNDVSLSTSLPPGWGFPRGDSSILMAQYSQSTK
jgi:hypothetical protein